MLCIHFFLVNHLLKKIYALLLHIPKLRKYSEVEKTLSAHIPFLRAPNEMVLQVSELFFSLFFYHYYSILFEEQ